MGLEEYLTERENHEEMIEDAIKSFDSESLRAVIHFIFASQRILYTRIFNDLVYTGNIELAEEIANKEYSERATLTDILSIQKEVEKERERERKIASGEITELPSPFADNPPKINVGNRTGGELPSPFDDRPSMSR